MSPELGLLVLAAIFAAGVVLVALALATLLPGLLLARDRLASLRGGRRRAEPRG